MGERVTAVGDTGDEPGEFPISPLLERSSINDNGHLEISVSAVGRDPLDANELDVFLRQSRIAPGERIELGVFVASEAIEHTDLDVFSDHDDIIDLEDPGTVRRRSSEQPAGGDSDGEAHAGERLESQVTGTETDTDTRAAIHTAVGETDHELTHKPLGGTGAGGPGYILEINTRSTAPPGAYSLPIVFTYRSSDGIKQVKEQRTVHVKTRRQQWEPWVTRVIIVLVSLAGLGTVFLLEPALFVS
ncbi:hypothetical protein [Natronolimnobius baerhuensis]|nr:hypothetical protein [Natronolimnobius baerhuensis]